MPSFRLLPFGSASRVATYRHRIPPPEPLSLDDQILLPPGFHIEIWADNLVRPRSLALGDSGTVFVGTSSHFSPLTLKARMPKPTFAARRLR